MQRFTLLIFLFVASCGGIADIKTDIEDKKQEIRSQNTVTELDALESLVRANQKNSFTTAIFRQSVAQVVFPKIVKAGFILGGNYGEGYLVRDGEVVARIDLAGGTFGLQAGTQSYAQVTYILSEERYRDLLSENRLSLSGSVSLAVSEQIQNAVMTSDAIKGDLYTVQFNETGTLLGASLDGIYYSVRQ
jgi:lipid-binding SYLF domain-containing protein